MNEDQLQDSTMQDQPAPTSAPTETKEASCKCCKCCTCGDNCNCKDDSSVSQTQLTEQEQAAPNADQAPAEPTVDDTQTV